MKIKYLLSILAVGIVIVLCSSLNGFAEEQNPIRIGIVDSGISSSSGINYIKGYNFISNTDDTEDDIGHGTALASVISWICPNAEILPLKVSGESFMTTAKITATAIYQAVDDFKCDILLLSFGQPNTEELHDAIKYAAENGVILISAVGNEGYISYRKNKIYYPAGYDEVIGIGSANDKGEVSFFSQINNSVFVVTNGEEVKSLNTDGTEILATGTSFSAAAIAGLAANVRAEDADTFKEYLKLNAIDKGIIGYDNSYGFGLIETEKLLGEED